MAGRGPGKLMGPYEICERLNVSRSRFQQIALRPTFPKPYQELRGMKVWLAEDIERWIAQYRPHQVDGE